eukprot:scaffold7427_cov101-Isochrysis_galbana.AAC.3
MTRPAGPARTHLPAAALIASSRHCLPESRCPHGRQCGTCRLPGAPAARAHAALCRPPRPASCAGRRGRDTPHVPAPRAGPRRLSRRAHPAGGGPRAADRHRPAAPPAARARLCPGAARRSPRAHLRGERTPRCESSSRHASAAPAPDAPPARFALRATPQTTG